jgi:predicted DNA-binding transcriptional regulator AlpA
VLTVGEAATRLGMSRAQLDAMIARGQVETLPIEFGRVVPTSEVDRLRKGG